MMKLSNEFQFKYLYPFFNHLENDKGQILEEWMANNSVIDMLNKHGISQQFFSYYFGKKVITYALGVIRQDNKLGNCPVIIAMLTFFKNKNIPLEDIFIICVNLKNAFIKYALEKKIINSDIIHEISFLMDNNFVGVIREYSQINHKISDNIIKEATESCIHLSATISSAEKEIHTSAFDYLQEVDIDIEILDELEEIEKEALSSFNLSSEIDYEEYREVIELFSSYVKVLNQLIEFKELAYTLTLLVELLQNTPLDQIEEEKRAMLSLYFKAIIQDLSFWRKAVFTGQSTNDIHYLDKTLLSSIAQLQILLSEQTIVSIDSIEFF